MQSRRTIWVRLTGKTELSDALAQTGKIGAYSGEQVRLGNDRHWSTITGGLSWSYPTSYLIEVNRSNANLHACDKNIVQAYRGVKIVTGSGSSQQVVNVWIFDKGVTDEPYSCRFIYNPPTTSC
jgi:hypothetical protein